MEVDYKDLCQNYCYYPEQFDSDEGAFSVLPPELRREIFSKIDNHTSIIQCSMVNHRWQKELLGVLYEYCVNKGILNDLPFWQKHASKDWKWLLRCSTKLSTDSGIGTIESDKGNYIGEWQSNKKSGWGKMQWKNGGFYQGHWQDNTKDGYGYQRWGIGTKWNGDTYEGQWVKSKRQGRGIYIWSTGDRYEGDWKDGRKEGVGSFRFFKSGNRYEGQYKNDTRNGIGTFYWANGDIYNGEWLNSEKQGIGTYTWSSGEVYSGNWDKSERSGKGEFVWTNGSRYIGDWDKNRMQGIGTYHWPDGDRFEGKWNANKRVEGVLVMSNGRVEQQYWNERDVNRSEIKNVVLRKFPEMTTDCYMEE